MNWILSAESHEQDLSAGSHEQVLSIVSHELVLSIISNELVFFYNPQFLVTLEGTCFQVGVIVTFATMSIFGGTFGQTSLFGSTMNTANSNPMKDFEVMFMLMIWGNKFFFFRI